MDDIELSERYVAVWNEPDAARRTAAVQALWHEDGRHLLQAPAEIRERAAAIGFPAATLEVHGHAALATRVTTAYVEFVAPGEYRFRRRGEPTRVGDAVRVAWDMVARDGTVAAGGVEFLLLDARGRIERDYQFID